MSGFRSLSFVVRRERAHAGTFEQEATEGTEIGSVLCFLRYLLLVWDSRHIRPEAADLFSCV